MVRTLIHYTLNDPVLVGLFLIIVVAFLGAGVYIYAICSRRNGHYQDTYIALLLLAFTGNYGYLFAARIMKYYDQDKFLFLLARNEYIPPLYISLTVMVIMIIHKIVDIKRK